MPKIASPISATDSEKLASDYEDAYVTHLEDSEGGVDLEDLLDSAFEVGDLAARMVAAGLRDRMKEIHAKYRWDSKGSDDDESCGQLPLRVVPG